MSLQTKTPKRVLPSSVRLGLRRVEKSGMDELSSVIEGVVREDRLVVSSVPVDFSSMSEHVSVVLDVVVVEHGGLAGPPVVGLQHGGRADSAGDSLLHDFGEAREVLELTVVSVSHVVHGLPAEHPPPVVVHVVQRNSHEEATGVEVFQGEFSEHHNGQEDLEQLDIIFLGVVEVRPGVVSPGGQVLVLLALLQGFQLNYHIKLFKTQYYVF